MTKLKALGILKSQLFHAKPNNTDQSAKQSPTFIKSMPRLTPRKLASSLSKFHAEWSNGNGLLPRNKKNTVF
jgi:hypothetical protein